MSEKSRVQLVDSNCVSYAGDLGRAVWKTNKCLEICLPSSHGTYIGSYGALHLQGHLFSPVRGGTGSPTSSFLFHAFAAHGRDIAVLWQVLKTLNFNSAECSVTAAICRP